MESQNCSVDKNALKVKIIISNLSISDFATKIGMGRTQLWKRMNGVVPFKVSEIKNISKVLNLSPNEICSIFFPNEVHKS